jgi:hypothetical protein
MREWGVAGIAGMACMAGAGHGFVTRGDFFARIAIRCLHGKPREWRNTARAYLVQAPAYDVMDIV